MITPREIIRDFLYALNILYQNPGATFDQVARITVADKGTEKTEYDNSADIADIADIEI